MVADRPDPTPNRIDSASRLIRAPAAALYRAFASPGAMEQWLPPTGMTGTMLDFDFHEGGSYRMRLTYSDAQQHQGKTTDDSDEAEVRLVRVEQGRLIEQEVTFASDDPAFAGIMRMRWTFEETVEGTRTTIRAEHVPPGIRPEDHEAAFESSLASLAAFVEGV